MAVDPKKLIAAINPDVYCSDIVLKEGDSPNRKHKTLRDLVKSIAEKSGYLKAAEKAELVETEFMEVADSLFSESPFKLEGIKHPVERHTLTYEMFSQNLEPLYFWLLEWINQEWGTTKKLTDNFVSSAGSGFFSEFGQKRTRMQEEAMKLLQTAGVVTKSILNIIYDLKEFKLVLSEYEKYNNAKSSGEKQAALLSLKQRWLDKVDIQKGNSSIKGLAQQFEYVTIIDAFMASNDLEHLKSLDLNDRVKRILQQRVSEFNSWVKESEKELKKRFEIEKLYLRNQVNSLKLYARWLKPYLKAVKQLEQKAEETPDIVTAFNTALFELTVLGLGKYAPDEDIANGDLPEYFKKLKLRKYFPVVLVELKFRSVPDLADQNRRGYVYRGRAEITLTSFSLNEDELKVFEEELKKDDLSDTYELIEGVTEKSLSHIQDDIDEFLEEKKEKQEEKKENSEDINPFSAIFDFFLKKEKKEKDSKIVKKDSDEEKVLRGKSALIARIETRKIYNELKKSLELPAFPPIVI